MKFLVVFFAVFALAQALTPAQKDLLKEHYKICSGSTGAPTELVTKVRSGDYEIDDDRIREFVFCVFKRIGIMSDDGKFHREVAIAKVEAEIRDPVGKAFDACVTQTGTHGVVAWEFLKCYHRERPNHDLF